MLRRNQYLQDRQSPLLNLPEDLLILILKLEKQNLKEIARISRRFHHIVNTVFRNTLYARTLKFETWQKEEVSALHKSIEDFIRNNEASIFNWPDIHNQDERNMYRILHLQILSILFIVFALSASMANLITLNTLESLGIGSLFGVVAAAAIGTWLYHHVNARRNAHYNTTIEQAHLDQLIALVNTHQEIIADRPLAPNARQLNVTTIHDLMNTLKADANLIEQASNHLVEFLIKESRFSSHKKFDAKQFDKLNDHGLKDYGLNLCLLWNERNRGNEIVEITEMDSIPRSPNVPSYGTFQR